MSFNPLIERIANTQNPTVVGLDPRLEYIPEFIKESAFDELGRTLSGVSRAFHNFNMAIIDAICDIVPAVKPQSAFYEALGAEGILALQATCDYATARGMYVILDGKRNDIGSTAEGYAEAYLGKVAIDGEEFQPWQVNALTVNGYLGTDGIVPFVKACDKHDKGIFVLVKTSNPSSGELQDKLIGDKSVYEIMGELTAKWGNESIGKYGYSAVGAVVGATYPAQIAELRKKLPATFFLIPGYGAQGGTAADLKAAFDGNGLGGIVNSSRGVICAYKQEQCDERDFAGAARRECLRMRDDLMSEIGSINLP
ncbi:MAG: orotidine-5'-phosphate decarboxylase [Oscillospiraceae bacterium]|nr:orotidine-5'-phosphate decarboxylase [Oscillospiraceae bacterium]